VPTALTHEERHHPAKYSGPVLPILGRMLDDWLPPPNADVEPIRVLDPWSGVGWIHKLSTLQRVTFAVELEHEWSANQGHAGRTTQASTRALPFAADTFAGCVGSPVYPNRMRDHHTAKDKSKRNTYTHRMRDLTGDPTRKLHPDNVGAMNDRQYAAASAEHIAEMIRVTDAGGFLILNVSNSIADEHENNAVEMWLNWLTLRRCHIREVCPVSTRRLRHGANWEARTEHEVVIAAQTPTVKTPSLL
jgi:hypothetical protein